MSKQTELIDPEIYEDVEKMLHKICYSFSQDCRSYLILDHDDLMSEARFWFCKAYHTHEHDLGKFSTWIWTKVVHGLQEYRRTIMDERAIRKDININTVPTRSKFDLDRLRFEISSDANKIIDVVLSGEYLTKEEKKNRRLQVFVHLVMHGWSPQRIHRVFQELDSVFQ